MIRAPIKTTDLTTTTFGLTTEGNRWGAVAFAVQNKAFVGLGIYSADINQSSTYDFKGDFWSFQSPVPDAPKALRASAATLTEVSLSWNDASNNEQGFSLERSVGDDQSFTELAALPTDATAYQDNSLESEKVYYYRVRALGKSESEHSPYTAVVSVNTYSAPSNLAGVMQSDTTVILSWQDNSTLETGFVVERSPDGTEFTTLSTLAADAITYTDSQAAAGTDYQYRVYALMDDVETDATRTTVDGLLAPPVSLRIGSSTGDEVSLAWDYPGSNASDYVIERKTGEADFTRLASVAIANGKQYSDTDVEEGQAYTYRIKTTDATGPQGTPGR